MQRPTFSPFEAVYGHDKTQVKRLTVAEYRREIQEEEEDVRGIAAHAAPSNGSLGGDVPQYQLRRAALSSRAPDVVFSSKYPMYDRLGRELCILYQIQDMSVEHELGRVKRGGPEASRRSGVRLSAELQLDTTTATARSTTWQEQKEDGCSADPRVNSRSHSRHPHSAGDAMSYEEDVCVSEMTQSRYSSVASTYAPSYQPTSGRPSDFSIYRDSHRRPTGHHGSCSVPMMVEREEAPECCAEACDELATKQQTVQCTRAKSFPMTVDKENAFVSGNASKVVLARPLYKRGHEDGEARGGDALRRRRLTGSAPRLSRVHFADEDEDETQQHPILHKPQSLQPLETQNTLHNTSNVSVENVSNLPPSASDPNPCLHSSPAFPAAAPDAYRLSVTASDVARYTVVRESLAVRATKQLFRAGTTTLLGRGTALLPYSNSIPSSAYGTQAQTIVATKVAELVEENVRAAAATVMDSSGSSNSEEAVMSAEATPEVQCGDVLKLGEKYYHVVRFYVVSGVYEVVEVEPPTQPREPPRNVEISMRSVSGCTSMPALRAEEVEEAQPVKAEVDNEDPDSPRAVDCKRGTDAFAEGQPVNTKEQETTASAAEGPGLRACETEGPSRLPLGKPPTPPPAPALVHHHETQDTTVRAVAVSPAPVGEHGQQQQLLLYRWRQGLLPTRGDEGRRAAIGLALCAPDVRVSSFPFSDGGGITLLTIPPRYRAVPLSGLPLGTRVFCAALKHVMKALSSMVARRTVHGNMSTFGEFFIALPTEAAGQGGEKGEGKEAATTTASAADTPIMIPVHWERMVDFSMFADRNAGRTIPLDTTDGTEKPLITQGTDLLVILQDFLEHKLSAKLTAEQYIVLQRLIVMATEPTQVANFLIQMSALMSALPSDMPALAEAFEAALAFYAQS